MIYPYACDTCNIEIEVMKPMAESSRKENCGDCGNELRRIFTTPSVLNYGNYFDTMSSDERWGYATHKQRLETEMQAKAAQGISVDKVEVPKGTPQEFVPQVPK